MTLMTLSANSGISSTMNKNWCRLTISRRQSLRAIASALRGESSMSDSSPKSLGTDGFDNLASNDDVDLATFDHEHLHGLIAGFEDRGSAGESANLGRPGQSLGDVHDVGGSKSAKWASECRYESASAH